MPKFCQVVPSVEYCQVPLPVFAVMAKPLSALVSTSAHVLEDSIELASVPLDVVSSLVAVNETEAALVIVGASLIELTLTVTVSNAVLNVDVPPAGEVFTCVPNVPKVWSHAR